VVGWGLLLVVNYISIMRKNHLKQLIQKHLLNFKRLCNQQTRNHQSHQRKNVYFVFMILRSFDGRMFLAAPSPEPPRPSAAANETITTITSPSASALVHLMSQFRMDRASEPMPISVTTLEKMSITDTQHFLADNGLEK
jgi:hypothetical protein